MRTIKQFVTGKTRHMVALRWITLVVILATTALLLTLPATAQTKYVITDGDNVIVCLSNSTDPQEVIKEAGLKLGESDTYTTHISDGVSEIHITRVQMISVKDGDQVYVVGSYGGDVEDVLQSLDITLSDTDTLSCTLDTATYDGMVVEITRVVLEMQEYDQPIPFQTRVLEDSSLAPGEEKILCQGVEGQIHYVAQITYENGEEIKRTVLSQQMVAAPQEAIILRGVDRSVMEQGFDHVDDYIISNDWYSYEPPTEEEMLSSTEQKFVPGTTLSYDEAVLFEATAYTCNSYEYVGNGITFTGTEARVGAIAVDPKVIPLGTKMYIASADGEYIYGYCVAEDTGGLIKGNLVDLYYDTHDECIQFGRRDIIIYFLN